MAPPRRNLEWRNARGGAVAGDDGTGTEASAGSTADGAPGAWDVSDDVMLLGLGVMFPKLTKAEINEDYNEHRGKRAMRDTLYSLTRLQNKKVLLALYAEFEHVLGRDKVFTVFKHARAVDRLIDVEDVTLTLNAIVLKKCGETEDESGLNSEGLSLESEAEAVELAQLVVAYAPEIEAQVVHFFFRKNGKLTWKARMHLDAHRRRRSAAPVPFVYLEIMEGARNMTAEERDAEYTSAHEPLRQIVLESHFLRDKAEKAEGDGETGVAAWLRDEAARMREEEGAARLKIAFRFFDTFANPAFCAFVSDRARVLEALDRRARNSQDTRFAGAGSAMFSVDLHMQRGKEVAPVLDRAVRMIVHSYPEERIEELLDVSIDVLFGKGSHSDNDRGPSLPGVVIDWVESHDFLEHSKDVVVNPSHILCGYRLSVRTVQEKQEKEDMIAMFRAMRKDAASSENV